jgi:hypothetical protein
MMGRVLIVAVVLLWPASGFCAGFQTGNDLYSECNSPKSSPDFNTCLAYVEGMADAFAGLPLVCFPSHVTVGQTVDIVMKYLRDHPEDRHYSAAGEALEALGSVFPCQNQNSSTPSK